MNNSASGQWGETSAILRELEKELSVVQAGSEEGLLPVYHLLSRLAEEPAIQAGVAAGEEWPSTVLKSHAAVENLLGNAAWSQAMIHWLDKGIQQGWEAIGKPGGVPGAGVRPERIEGSEMETVVAVRSPDLERKLNDAGDFELTVGNEDEVLALREFIGEMAEQLGVIESESVRLETAADSKDGIDALFRSFHTLKGSAGFVGLQPVATLAHRCENLLQAVRQGTRKVDAQLTDAVLAGADRLKWLLHSLQEQTRSLLVGGRIRLKFLGEENLDWITGGNAMCAFGQNGSGQGGGAEVIRLDDGEGPKSALPFSFVKVNPGKLDALLDMVGELVVNQSLLMHHPIMQQTLEEDLVRQLNQLRRVTADLQRAALALRMVPVRHAFQKMPRVVRDLARGIGKEIQLRVSGERTELDRTIVERMVDPLVHLVRNAVDHGIESGNERQARGKRRAGQIALRAYHRGGHIVIEIEDDGRGLDAERIRQKAIKLGFPMEQYGSTQELWNLIFLPGFSTVEQVSEISGRGVGMDIVRREVEALRGRIDVASKPGEGSVFSVSFPLTLAILEGLIVRVGDHLFVVPAESVKECIHFAVMSCERGERGEEAVMIRETRCPVLRLGEYFELNEQPGRRGVQGVVIEADGTSRCLVVDEVVRKQEVVVRSLGEAFNRLPALAGGAILGDGKIGLILDVNILAKLPGAGVQTAA